MARISTRQVTYMVTTELRGRRITHREPGTCGGCSKPMLCSRIVQTPGFVLSRSSAPERRQRLTDGLQPPGWALSFPGIDLSQPWYWEGNVQRVAAQWLETQGWTVAHTANTAADPTGVDIVARQPPRKELWVTVKGFPESSEYFQAGDWFASAIFDLVAYRNRSSELYLAVALPGCYPIYLELALRTGWLKKTMPFTFLWVSEAGRVQNE